MNHKELVILSLITFLTIIAWIIFGVYHARTTSTVTQTQLKQIVPLNPGFDNETLKSLKGRED